MADKKDELLNHYGSATIGERGQIVLPIEARKRFNVKPGDRLMVMGSDTCGFESIVLMKSEAIVGLLNHTREMEGLMKEGKNGMDKILKRKDVKSFFDQGGTDGLAKRLKAKKK